MAQDMVCTICQDEIHAEEAFALSCIDTGGCSLRGHGSCLERYIAWELQKGSSQLRCPQCRVVVEPKAERYLERLERERQAFRALRASLESERQTRLALEAELMKCREDLSAKQKQLRLLTMELRFFGVVPSSRRSKRYSPLE